MYSSTCYPVNTVFGLSISFLYLADLYLGCLLGLLLLGLIEDVLDNDGPEDSQVP